MKSEIQAESRLSNYVLSTSSLHFCFLCWIYLQADPSHVFARVYISSKAILMTLISPVPLLLNLSVNGTLRKT